MALKHLQQVLARIFTNEALRGEFLADPLATARRLAADVNDVEVLASLDLHAISHFADSIRQKRVLYARKRLPLTYQVLGAEFDGLMVTVIHGAPRAGHDLTDATAFVRQLCKLVARQAVQPVWIADLARYELAVSEAATAGACCILRRFRFPITAITGAVARGSALPSIEPRMNLGLWLRFGHVNIRVLVRLGMQSERK